MNTITKKKATTLADRKNKIYEGKTLRGEIILKGRWENTNNFFIRIKLEDGLVISGVWKKENMVKYFATTIPTTDYDYRNIEFEIKYYDYRNGVIGNITNLISFHPPFTDQMREEYADVIKERNELFTRDLGRY